MPFAVRIRVGRVLACVVLALGLGASAHAADPPRRVVSFNVCADQLVLALAEPGQIAALSPNAADPAMSTLAEEARAFPRVGRTAETIAPLDPDLVLVGPWDRPLTQRMLRALGFRTVPVDLINDIDGALVQIREIAALLGHPEKGAALEADIAAARARLVQARRPAAATALLVGNGGYTVGPASLAAALMAEAGLNPPPGAPSGYGGYVPLEALIKLRPDYLVMSNVVETPDGQGALYLTHPALRALYPPARRIILPGRLTVCGGPALVAAFDYLTDVVTRLQAGRQTLSRPPYATPR
jgi:iron complex transport system substrate-binding protein